MISRPRRSALCVLAVAGGLLASAGTNAGAAPATHDSPATPRAGSTAPTVLQVDARRGTARVSPLLTGVNNDQWFGDSHGLYDPADNTFAPEAVAGTRQAGVGVIRYPGGTPAQLFHWKRAIGPQASRGCQTNGADRTAVDSRYGVDEHMAFVAQAGAQASMMVNFVTATPSENADLVEYLDAPLGTNPGGGTAWADVRAANGHPQPYHVHYFEIGNELDRTGQRYWMSADTATALHQYAFGGSQPQVNQQAGKGCDFTSRATSDGTGAQTFSVEYPPVAPGSATVRVGSATVADTWRQVGDLAGAGPDDRVYTLDPTVGAIHFGDGVHGAIPDPGSRVYVDYVSGPHAGFLQRYRAMKAVDPHIDVCATWAPITPETGLDAPGFPELMAQHGVGDQYDCLIVHPYTNFRVLFGDTFATARDGHDWFMLGEANAAHILATHVAAVRANAPARTYVTTSEFGALFFGAHDDSTYPSWQTAMSHATYFASQWARLLDLGVPWSEGNTLISETPDGLRGVLGGAPGFAFTAEAVVRQALRPIVEGGGTVVAHRVIANPVIATEPTAHGSSYSALVTTATRDAHGRLSLVVVNRGPEQAVPSEVVTPGYRHTSTATVSTVAGSSFQSFNSLEHPNDVQVATTSARVGHGSFGYAFPAHSVTIIRLSGR